MVISSKENKNIKLLQKLSQKKYRDEYGLFVVEGLRGVRDIMQFDESLIDQIFVSENKSDQFPNANIVSERIFASVCETENSQGILAIVKKPISRQICSNFVLFLDRVRDPGNVGTLIRTACAAGYNDVILHDCADPYSGKVVRSTMSAIAKVNLILAGYEYLSNLKRENFNVICADMDGNNVFDYKTDQKVCIVIGNEANGVSDEAKKLCDTVLSIPMDGKIESLNAGVSGAIMMYYLKYKTN